MQHIAALLLVCGLATLGSSAAQAQAVALTGMLGDKALLVVEVAGSRQTLCVGDSPISIKGKPGASENGKIILQAGSNGHFISAGQINGQAVQFMVDTGASVVALSVADAERVGLNYRAGQVVHMNTANGVSQG